MLLKGGTQIVKLFVVGLKYHQEQGIVNHAWYIDRILLIQIYLNGSLDNHGVRESKTRSVVTTTSWNDFLIGNLNTYDWELKFFKGSMDEILFWNEWKDEYFMEALFNNYCKFDCV